MGDTATRTCLVGVCDGSGWIVDGNLDARSCECRRKRSQERLMARLKGRIPSRYRGVSFDRPPISDMARSDDSRTAVAAVREFCGSVADRIAEGQGLWLSGPPGTGKTTLAMLASKTAIEAGHAVAVYSTPALLGHIRGTFDDEGDTYEAFVERLKQADLLHLDDLGAERTTDWVLEQLYQIINARYADERSILVTTNLNADELVRQVGDRIVSRLAEMCEEVYLGGRDHRFDNRLETP